MSATVRSNKRLLKPLVTSGPVPPAIRERLTRLHAEQPQQASSSTEPASPRRRSHKRNSDTQIAGKMALLESSCGNESSTLLSPQSQLQRCLDQSSAPAPPSSSFNRGHRRNSTTISLSFHQQSVLTRSPATNTHLAPPPTYLPTGRDAQLPRLTPHVRRPSLSLAFAPPFNSTCPRIIITAPA